MGIPVPWSVGSWVACSESRFRRGTPLPLEEAALGRLDVSGSWRKAQTAAKEEWPWTSVMAADAGRRRAAGLLAGLLRAKGSPMYDSKVEE